MKYLCQVWFNDQSFADFTPEKSEKLDRRSRAEDAELERSGHLIMASPLDEPNTATTVRVRDGKTSVTDGPYIETKEYLGGFLLIEARDMNEAISLVAKTGVAEIGAIEVRALTPIKDWDAP